MTMFSWLADRLILVPSKQPLDGQGKLRKQIDTAHGFVELWTDSYPKDAVRDRLPLRILKFPGAAGRAERAGVHPAEILTDFQSEIATVNQHGYGGSSGPASIKKFPDVADSVFAWMRSDSEHIPILLVGNSLGCLSALYLAARYSVAGMVLRNPPPLRPLISTRPRYASWNFGMSKWIANEVPEELDAIANAKRADVPCLFIQSEKDRVVPPKYQDLIFESYAGPLRKFVIADADHHHSVSGNEEQDYFESVRWLKNRMDG